MLVFMPEVDFFSASIEAVVPLLELRPMTSLALIDLLFLSEADNEAEILVSNSDFACSMLVAYISGSIFSMLRAILLLKDISTASFKEMVNEASSPLSKISQAPNVLGLK